MNKTFCTLLCAACGFTSAIAQNDDLMHIQLEARIDYMRDYVDGSAIRDNSGFKGKYLGFLVEGNLNKHFSYSYRQRFNKPNKDSSFFDSTDWIYVNYSPNEHWDISAGKQVVCMGGFEYDRAPINLYYCSEFWHNISCYQMGLTASYSFYQNKNKLTFQFTQSPFNDNASDTYAYNLTWTGRFGWFNTNYSANLLEYNRGKYISYLALGHQFKFDRFAIELDYMNRASSHQTYLFKDFSIIGEVSYRPNDRWNVFGKVTYDVNRTDNVSDFCVLPGTELTSISGGLEYYILRNRHDLRVHAVYAHTFGKNGNENGTMFGNQNRFDIGVMCCIDLFTWKKK